MAVSGAVLFEERQEDLNEREKIEDFHHKGCGCQRGIKKSPCSRVFPLDFLQDQREHCQTLSDEQLDMVVLGQLSSHRRYPIFVEQYHKMRAHRKPEDLSEGSSSLERFQESFRHTTRYYIHDIPICETTFCFLYTLSRKRLQNLQNHIDENGLTPRTHGLTGIPPKNSFGPDCIEDIVTFIRSIAEVRSIAVPGRLPGVKNLNSVKLPSDMSKASVYREYVVATSKTEKEPVSLSTFKDIWLKYVPEVSFMKPQTDLCQTCQENAILVLRSAGLPDKEKQGRYKEALDHLQQAETQRNHYNKQCEEAKGQTHQEDPATVKTLSFDYAQNLMYPHSSSQVGPAYFKTARRCGLFGVLCEGSGVQTNFLLDECENVGKGANSVISMLDHYLENSDQAKKIQLHADNCTGQNKNNAMMEYLSWRVLTSKQDEIEISFMLAGHTKFGPDRMFGLVKKKYNLSTVDTLDDIANVVCSSTLQNQNKPVMTYDYVRDKRMVVWRDWSTFLGKIMKPIPGILKFRHFRIEKKSPFMVFVKTNADAPEHALSIQKCNIQDVIDAGMPDMITPKGLELNRQWYLYEEVAPLCKTMIARSLTCPKPDRPKPRKRKCAEE